MASPTAGQGPFPAAGPRLEQPVDGSVIAGQTRISGMVGGGPQAAWTLELRRAAGGAWQILAQGRGGAVFATLDAARLPTGLYEVRLGATDAVGGLTTASSYVVVAGRSGPRAVRYQVVDLGALPDAGSPQLERVYDSRNTLGGDFGPGWSLAAGGAAAEATGPLGVGWELATAGGSTCLRPARTHLVAVVLPDERVLRFRPVVEPPCAAGARPDVVSVSFESLDDPGATLEPVGEVFVGAPDQARSGAGAPASPLAVELVDFTTAAPVDPERYQLTLADGRRLRLRRGGGVEDDLDPNGNGLIVEPGGLRHTSGAQLRLERDSQGRIVLARDDAGNAVRYTYDGAGLLGSVLDAEGRSTTYTYSLGGQLVMVTDPEGGRTAFAYDLQGRLVRRSYPDGAAESFVYAPDGTLEQATGAWGTTRYEYQPVAPGPARMTLEDGRYVRYEYDAQGRRTAVAHAAGAGAPETVVRYAYDAAGRVTSVQDETGTMRLRYDAAGNRVAVERPNGVSSRYSYAAAGRLLAVEHRGPDGAVLAVFSGGAGATGPAGATPPPAGAAVRSRLVFDGAGRLLRYQLADRPSVAYTYAPTGWRQSRSDHTGTIYYLVDESPDLPLGRLLRESDRSGVTRRTYSYLPGSGVPVSWTEAGRAAFPLEDGSGTVRLVTDGAGRPVAGPAGAPGVEGSGAGSGEPHFWRGERLDAEGDVLVALDGLVYGAPGGGRLNRLSGSPRPGVAPPRLPPPVG